MLLQNLKKTAWNQSYGGNKVLVYLYHNRDIPMDKEKLVEENKETMLG